MVKRQYLFKVEAIENKLPNNLKEVTLLAVFKTKLKEHILDNY